MDSKTFVGVDDRWLSLRLVVGLSQTTKEVAGGEGGGGGGDLTFRSPVVPSSCQTFSFLV